MIYETLFEKTLEVSGPEAEFVERVRKTMKEGATRTELVEMIYGQGNPVLGVTSAGTPWVTQDVLNNPAYHAVLDILDRGAIARGEVTLDKMRAAYSITLAEAAEALGVHQSAVRQALQSGRLNGIKRANSWFVHPASLASLGIRGRKPKNDARISARIGHSSDGAMKVKAELVNKIQIEPGIVEGDMPVFEKMLVHTSQKGKKRAFVIERGVGQESIQFHGFHVTGRFRIVQKINNAREADKAWTEWT